MNTPLLSPILSPILSVNSLHKHYETKKLFGNKKTTYALQDIHLDIFPGETLSIVGESGSGKSTLARVLSQLEAPTQGQIRWSSSQPPRIQMIFQDPKLSLNPKKTILTSLLEPLRIQNQLSSQQQMERVTTVTQQVGLNPELLARYPHMLSGGQRQRVGIARALMILPDILILDEPLSALDVSIQSQILNLLLQLQQDLKLTYLFISHDLNIVKLISHRTAVMYLGQIIESAPTQELFKNPNHPYTRALLDSAKNFNPLEGEIPSPFALPRGCSFAPRCQYRQVACEQQRPNLSTVGSEHLSRCLLTLPKV